VQETIMSTPPSEGQELIPVALLHPLNPSRLVRLARKELAEILRDRRTIVTLVVMPLLLYPLLTIALGQFVLGGRTTEEAAVYRIGFVSNKDYDDLQKRFDLEKQRLHPEALTALPRPEPRLFFLHLDNLEANVRDGVVDVAFRRKPAAGPAVKGEVAEDWELIYREDSLYAHEAMAQLERLCSRANAEILSERLKETGVRQRPAPIRLTAAPLATNEHSGLSLAVFVPLVLILMTMTGAVYPAIDLTAGERERGTLEVLLAAPVPRVSLLFGKYVAVVTVAVLTALVNLGSLSVSLLVGGFAERVFGPGGIRVGTLLEIFGLVLLFAAFFAAVLLVLTSFARSFKEAQAYLIPLMVVALVPGVVGLLPGLRLTGLLTVVPLLNIVLLARDLLEEHADPVSAVVVVVATAAYAVLAITLAAQVFGAEGVLYGESGGWCALLRRRS
jgi:ABC-2 type transport system permease protein/sodium transport system permease protein